jgi:tRNA-2-methylthio-N6-dimethylallyladenosine synthase
MACKELDTPTSHPNDMHDDLYEAHAICSKLMPYLHLPIQSGSNKILKSMNRKHSKEDYIKIIEKLRVARPDLAFSSDFIVGFPGETEADFQETLDVVEYIKYSGCFSFKYSERPGTPAELYDNQIAEAEKSERLQRLQDLLNKQQFNFNKLFYNKDIEVLFEKKQGDKIMGRSPYLQPVFVDFQDNLIGKIKKVSINKSSPHSLSGNLK